MYILNLHLLFLSKELPTTRTAHEARDVLTVSDSEKPQDREDVSGKQLFEWMKDFTDRLSMILLFFFAFCRS